MLINFLVIAIRRIAKDRFYSLVNMVGLTVGIMCALVIGRYVIHEMTTRKCHPKGLLSLAAASCSPWTFTKQR